MLEVNQVVKKYAGKPALDQLSLKLEKGHIYGLLGPNGSGKSTLMKMIDGLIAMDSGSITLDGNTIGPKTKAHIAYMSTEPFYYSYMKVKDVSKYYADFFEDFDTSRFERYIKQMDLSMDLRVRALSSGMAAKLKIAATMARKADIYLLDEPFNGIDLLARDEIVDIILDSFDPDSTLVISSHMVEELEKIIDWAVFISEGRVLLEGDVEKLREDRNQSIADTYRELYRFAVNE